MQAVCAIQGKQFIVETNQSLLVDHIPQEVGTNLTFDTVGCLIEKENVQVGSPYVSAKVEAVIENHVRGKKIRVFKRRRRKDSKKLIGHRSQYTQIRIKKISASS